MLQETLYLKNTVCYIQQFSTALVQIKEKFEQDFCIAFIKLIVLRNISKIFSVKNAGKQLKKRLIFNR